MPVPERLRWAIEVVSAEAPATVLEIGCGSGVAIELLCELPGGVGEIVGLDRSEAALHAAAERNARHIAAGRVRLVHGEIGDAPLAEAKFQAAFAVNVNVFWVKSATEELAAVRRALTPTGRLMLIYEPPSAPQAARIEATCTRSLEENGFSTVNVARRDLSGRAGLCILARASPPE